MTNIYYIYALIDPNTLLPFYIGKGKDDRCYSHLKGFDICNVRKSLHIIQLQESGTPPIVEKLVENINEEAALLKEIELIALYGRKDYDTSGILLNLTMGGDDGDTSLFFTEESRKKISLAKAGEKHHNAKFTNEQVIDVYHSTTGLDELAEKYKCNRYCIIAIKRKLRYRSILCEIRDLPGFPDKQGSTPFPIPIDLIPEIFYDTGDYDYFWEKYRASPRVVKGIKTKKSFKRLTAELERPGQVKRYGMTQQMVDDVYNAVGTNPEIAKRFGIHYNTVRNIKSKYSRAFNMWEEF